MTTYKGYSIALALRELWKITPINARAQRVLPLCYLLATGKAIHTYTQDCRRDEQRVIFRFSDESFLDVYTQWAVRSSTYQILYIFETDAKLYDYAKRNWGA